MPKQFDNVEPFLEPLYLPAIFAFFALILGYVLEPLGVPHLALPTAFSLFGMVFASVMVVVYETRLWFGRAPRRAIFSSQKKTYRFFRWLFAALGFVSVMYSIYFALVMGALIYAMR